MHVNPTQRIYLDLSNLDLHSSWQLKVYVCHMINTCFVIELTEQVHIACLYSEPINHKYQLNI